MRNFAFEGKEMRTIVNNQSNEIWWVGKDVCRCLDLSDTSKSLSRLDDDEKGTHTIPTLGGPQNMVCINEAGLYRLIFTSRKEEAERFKRWIAHDVLPSIRETGSYSMGNASEDEPITGADAIIQIGQTMKRLETNVERIKDDHIYLKKRIEDPRTILRHIVEVESGKGLAGYKDLYRHHKVRTSTDLVAKARNAKYDSILDWADAHGHLPSLLESAEILYGDKGGLLIPSHFLLDPK